MFGPSTARLEPPALRPDAILRARETSMKPFYSREIALQYGGAFAPRIKKTESRDTTQNHPKTYGKGTRAFFDVCILRKRVNIGHQPALLCKPK